MLEGHQLLRIRKLYRQAKPQPAYRSKLPLGIPTIRDLVAQMAVKLVIDVDVSKYFDGIPHAKLMAVLAESIVDGAMLHIIRMWLKAPVVGEDEHGTRRSIGGGKANILGTRKGV